MSDWIKIEIPEEPPIEDSEGFFVYLRKWTVAKEKMENLLEVMAQEIVASKTDEYKKPIKKQKIESKRVFIVHGTDYEPVKELKAVLQEVGIKPIILHEQPSKGMTIIEKLEEYSNVGFAFILLTPDDLGISKEEVAKIFSMPKGEHTLDKIKNFLIEILEDKDLKDLLVEEFDHLKDRARQNVVLEFGYFIGKLSRSRVCCLYKGNIELPSDMQGICYLHFNESVKEVKETIFNELKAAGFEFKPKLSEKCHNCGEPLEPNMEVCPKCGSKDRDIAIFDQSRGQDS